MEYSKAFLEAKKEIENLYLEHGEPAMNDGRSATTEARGFDLAVADNEESTEVVDRYNIELETLARMIDKRHIGSGIWYTSYYSTKRFSKFADEAEPIIQHFIETYEW